MRSKYEYFLYVDADTFYIPIKVFKVSGLFCIKSSIFENVITSDTEENVYTRFENKLYEGLITYHTTGQLWKIFPKYAPGFRAESCRLVARPRRWWKLW